MTVRQLADDPGGLSTHDVVLAREISAAAPKLCVPADPSGAQHVQVSIGALVTAEVLPFWRAVLPNDRAAAHIAATLAAGGHMVNDMRAPNWWTLADAERNEVDLATWG